MMKVKAEDPGGLSVMPLIPAASTSELDQTQDSKDLMFSVRQMLVKTEEVPHDQTHIKEEEEELWISQEEEQLTAKSEDEEKPQLSELHHIKTEDNREIEAPTTSSAEHVETEPHEEDFGRSERDRNPDPLCSCKHSRITFHKKRARDWRQSGTRTSDQV
ncbi:hypothetical protein ILYODFUR_010464 [Ilyodon furcidens]|uniref:Uncharacterized protein n=1 Tax=Ilyodon furcidens TaxID=33524 RepID=A0ABV0SW79_9TELE